MLPAASMKASRSPTVVDVDPALASLSLGPHGRGAARMEPRRMSTNATEASSSAPPLARAASARHRPHPHRGAVRRRHVRAVVDARRHQRRRPRSIRRASSSTAPSRAWPGASSTSRSRRAAENWATTSKRTCARRRRSTRGMPLPCAPGGPSRGRHRARRLAIPTVAFTQSIKMDTRGAQRLRVHRRHVQRPGDTQGRQRRHQQPNRHLLALHRSRIRCSSVRCRRSCRSR